MNNTYPIGTPLTILWHLSKPDGSAFDLAGFSYDVFYSHGLGSTAVQSSMVSASEDTISIVFPQDFLRPGGSYSLQLRLYQNGKQLCALNYKNAFSLFGRPLSGAASQEQEETSGIVHLYSAAEFYLLSPVVPTVGEDLYWYANGVKLTDSLGNWISAAHTVRYDGQTRHFIIDEGRVDAQGQSIEQVITVADEVLSVIEENEATRQEHEESRIETENRMKTVLESIVVNFLSGTDLYEQAVEQGYEGTKEEWLTSTLGVKGVGISSWEVEESSADSGTTTHTITFNDSDKPDGPTIITFNVKNGKGIASVQQTTTSQESDGVNVITVTMSDGTTATFQVKNGARGNSGYSGAAEDLEVVNHLDADDPEEDAAKALSAYQGHVLDGKISQLGQNVNELGQNVDELGQWIESEQYIDLKTDGNGKIIEAIKANGTKVFYINVDVLDDVGFRSAIIQNITHNKYVEVTIDDNNKVLEGITIDGAKHISMFDEDTSDLIKRISASKQQRVFIPLLDTNFVSPFPVTITGEKGTPTAKYEFLLPLGKQYNIRAKFKLTEDLLRENKTAKIASVGGGTVTAYPIALGQCVTDSSNRIAIDVNYEGPTFINEWPAYSGGISFNKDSKNNILDKLNIGKQAFSIRYVGNGNSATCENDGNELIFVIDGTTKSFSFSTYPTINELYEALRQDVDFELTPITLDYHNSSELAVFTSVKLKSNLHGNTNQIYHPEIIEYTDNGPFYLHYAISDDWHQIEFAKVGNVLYSICDGNVIQYPNPTGGNILTLGGECSVIFKDIEIYVDSVADFEFINNIPISSVNPYIVIFEAHGSNVYPAYQQPTIGPNGYNQNIDTLDWVFSWCKNKGYIPVTIEDICEYYISGKPLPKRCYTIVFDGWCWDDVMLMQKRSVFHKYGVLPALAIEQRPKVIAQGIIHNGQSITIPEAVAIAKINGFSVVNHTINHTSTWAIKPSDRVDFVTGLIYAYETDGMNGEIYVFPGGSTDPYMNEVFEYLAVKAGIEVYRGRTNNITRNRFVIGRIDISTTYKLVDGVWVKIDFDPGVLRNVI